MIHVNPRPNQQIHVGACGGVGWPVRLRATDDVPDLGSIANARLVVRKPAGSTTDLVTWPMVITSDDSLARPAYYRFKGADVDQEIPDLEKAGNYIGYVEVDTGDGKYFRFGDDMLLTVIDTLAK